MKITPYEFLEYCMCVSVAVLVVKIGWSVIDAIIKAE
jgi:hypothetical protein